MFPGPFRATCSPKRAWVWAFLFPALPAQSAGWLGARAWTSPPWAVEWGVGLAEADGAGAVDGVSELPQASSKAKRTNPIDKVMGGKRESALGITVAPRP